MEKYTVSILTEQNAREICSWRYPDEYSVYNFSDWETVLENGWDLSIKEKRDAEYVAVLQMEELIQTDELNLKVVLIAYGRISTIHNTTYIGIGLKPECCGLGLGTDIMNLLIDTAKERMPNKIIAVEVREFNKRALVCYKKIGFVEKDRYRKQTLMGEDEFIYLEYSEN